MKVLLHDKRVRAEQDRYEAFSRQRNAVLTKYRKAFQAYKDLQQGLDRAKAFYSEMADTVDSLKRNIDSFVENRRSEGGALLGAIEERKGNGADREQARLKDIMERMSISSTKQPSAGSAADQRYPRPPPVQAANYGQPSQQAVYNPAQSPPITPGYPQHQVGGYPYAPSNGYSRHESHPQRDAYNPNAFGHMSPPAHQQYFSSPLPGNNSSQSSNTVYGYGNTVPPGWQPPPPPPGPPPQQEYGSTVTMGGQQSHQSGPGGHASPPSRTHSQPSAEQGDPWAGLNSWR